MDLTGPLRLYRWRNALQVAAHTVCGQDIAKLELLLELPYSSTGDKAEGIALFPYLDEPEALLVIYDSPNQNRLIGSNGIYGDVFRRPDLSS